MDEKEIITKAIMKFGDTMQKIVAMEEMSELIKEISKDIRGQGSKQHLLEEIADVELMIRQLKVIYSIPDGKIEDEIKFKLWRLNGKLNELL